MNIKKIKTVSKKSFKSVAKITPMLLAIVGLIGLFKAYITPDILRQLFNGHIIHDEFIGIFTGAISVGQPFMSYIIGGELLKLGVSYYAVTAFLISYITLGVIQLPMQFEIFGMKFTVLLNILSLIFSVIVSIAIVITLQIIGAI